MRYAFLFNLRCLTVGASVPGFENSWPVRQTLDFAILAMLFGVSEFMNMSQLLRL
jgi:hypothetical protein